ncbi:MAG: DNA alkylation repair protein [Bryobacteraceae bacterium]|nr:DNA alkylation repair protein [Bryobacteraceae bacterium]
MDASRVPERLIEEVRNRLRAAADPAHGDGVRRFFTQEDGRTVDAYGVRSSALGPIVQFTYSQIKSWPAAQRNRLCTEFWKSGKLEEGVLVCHTYRRFASQCAKCEFQLFTRWLDLYVDNWAHCDGLASWLLAACIANQPALIGDLFSWTPSKNRWRRRAAAVALLQEAKKGRHTEEILRMAEALRCDPDVMVQKGIGWVLKEAYPKRPDAVVSYLGERASDTPRLVLRYAAEKMTPEDRAAVLQR